MIKRLTRLLPPGVRARGRPLVIVGRRVRTLAHAMRVVTGNTLADRALVRRSMRANLARVLRNPSRWQPPTLLEDGEIAVRGFGRFAVRGGSDDLVHVLPWYQRDIALLIDRFVKPGDIAIDAGANMGVIAVLMARATGPSGRVIAVEMMPDTAALLRRNIALNGLAQVEAVETALSDRDGETITAEVPVGLFGRASIVFQHDRPNTRRIAVRTRTLDDVAATCGRIALMKLDLEGAEAQALRGADQMLRRTDAIVMETMDGPRGETATILRGYGFTIDAIDRRNILAYR